MSRRMRIVGKLTMLFSTVVGAMVGVVAMAGPAAAVQQPPGGGAGSVNGGTTGAASGGLAWWAVLLIVVAGVVAALALASLTRFEIRQHRHVGHPAM